VPRFNHYDLPPVSGIEVYRRDTVVVRTGKKGGRPPALLDCKREQVKELSDESRARLAFVACNTDVTFRTMITLTYPRVYPSDGQTVKRHLHAWFAWANRRWGKFDYLWFLEFQRRGAPHIHLLTNHKWYQEDKAALSEAWYRIVGSHDQRHLAAGTRIERIRKPDGAARYCLKYAFKCHQKQVPDEYTNVGRFWGHSNRVAPRALVTCDADDLSVRALLKGWQYEPQPDRPLYRVLYGTGPMIHDQLPQYLDNPEEPW